MKFRTIFMLIIILIICNTGLTTYRRIKSMRKSEEDISKKLGSFSTNYVQDKMIKESKGQDPDFQFQAKYYDQPDFLFLFYFNQTFKTVKRYIDNYLNLVTEGKYLYRKDSQINGKKLKKYIDWTIKFATIKKGIFKDFSPSRLKQLYRRVRWLLRNFKLVKNAGRGGPEGYQQYFNAYKSGIRFFKRMKKALKKQNLYRRYKMKRVERRYNNVNYSF